MSRDYKTNDLFSVGSNYHLNACVGTNGGPYDFRDYAHGYFLAGKRLLESLRQDYSYVDTLVYPLTFLLRHAIELSLKGLARDLSTLHKTEGQIKLTHRLADNWAIVRDMLQLDQDVFDEDRKLIPFLDKVLKDYLEFDPSGEVFRFPEDRNGALFLQDASIINVEVFGSILEEVAEIIEYWFYQVEDLRRQSEMKNEY
ncbi:MAG: hypothetical protein HXX12_07545 [Geothrix sp.]|uniref:hypothetical protein n=1 Tax=Geothrix sp. TaxID=1962974 RepID=UPI0017CF1D79|nr:hypothetical protein [Geothrix sp.]NWJ40810.1 hypothetical protein [Geothrix sp.]WIL21188.1 MAG: hypothetical protein QOZ81_000437 [Geothrix sp.]